LNSNKLKQILESIKSGGVSVEDAISKLKHLPYEDISFAKVDHHRHLRQGVPEVIFAAGKTEEQVISIAKAMYKKSRSFLVSRATERIYSTLKIKKALFHPASGMISIGEEKKKKGNILVLTAGTSDIPVADEAVVTSSFLGSR